jgi:hypothetical protein
MDPVEAYLRRRQNLIDQIQHRHRHRVSAASSIELADRILSDEEKAEDEKRQWQPAHWNPPTNCPEWYSEAWQQAYSELLEKGLDPDSIDLAWVEERIRSNTDTKRHRQRLRLAVLESLWRAAQAPEETDDRANIVDRVILYEQAVSRGVELDDVNEALQLMAIDRKTRKEQNRLAYIVRRMKGGRSAVTSR